jgi:hypothetical protein
MKASPFSSIISVVLSPVLIMAPLWAQTPAPVSTGAEPDALQVRLLNADEVPATLRPGAKQSLTMQVTDSSGAAVSNAAVTCRLPDNGATGTFADGSHAAVAYTDSQGRATIEALQWGEIPGSVAIRLTATKGTTHTGILVETNLARPSGKAQAVNAPAEARATPQHDETVVGVPYAAQAAPTAPQPAIAEPAVSVMKPADKPSRQPGQLAGQGPAANPGPNKLTPEAADPTVSVTHTSAAEAPHSSHAKWFVVAGIVAAAGAGAAFAMKGKGSSSSSNNSNSSLSIGSPSISVGKP